jgi:type I restriction enzyme R subunit
VQELEERFLDTETIVTEKNKKEFVKLFGEYLRVENLLQNYDEFARLKALQNLDMSDEEAVEEFKAKHYLSDEDLDAMKDIKIPDERVIQDYRSTYNDIRDWLRHQKNGDEQESSTIDWDDVVFEVDLLKSQEINLDYILELIFEHNKKTKDKVALLEEIRRTIRASLENRAKEGLIVEFINSTQLDKIEDKPSILDAFYSFAQEKLKEEVRELIDDENLNEEATKRYIDSSLKRKYASENGTELNAILPKMSPLNPEYLTKKQSVFQKIASFIEKFKGISGKL